MRTLTIELVPIGRLQPYRLNAPATLNDVVNFYDQRFLVGFTDQEKADLVAFLKTL
jgi:hypothetical protein